jgi:hypothetical protein
MTMRHGVARLILSALTAVAVGQIAVGQTASAQEPHKAAAGPHKGAAAPAWQPRKTAWGDPDLQGTWPLDQLGRTPFQRPAAYGNRLNLTDEEYAKALASAQQAAKGAEKEEKDNKLGAGHWFEGGLPLRQTSLIVEPANGHLPPLTEKGKQLAASMRSSWTQTAFDTTADFNSLDRCITRGLPASMIPFPYNNGVRIFQSPGYVVIQLEIVHETRIIPLDGRPQLPGNMQTWLGSSRGHFEGNTLVIDSANFNGESPMAIVSSRATSVPTSTQMHVVERLTPTGPNTIQYDMTVTDPDILTAPWKMSFPWTRNETYEFYEYACHEGNEQTANYIRATSPRFAEERARNGGIAEGLKHASELGAPSNAPSPADNLKR